MCWNGEIHQPASFFFLLTNTNCCFLIGFGEFVYILKSREICFSFSKTDSVLCISHCFLLSFILMIVRGGVSHSHNSQGITFSNQLYPLLLLCKCTAFSFYSWWLSESVSVIYFNFYVTFSAAKRTFLASLVNISLPSHIHVFFSMSLYVQRLYSVFGSVRVTFLSPPPFLFSRFFVQVFFCLSPY